VYSSASGEIASTSASGSSSRCSGGRGESGISSNSGRCFSRVTRSDFGIATSGGSIRIGSCTSRRLRTCSTLASRSTAATSPTLRSRHAVTRAVTVNQAFSSHPPSFSMAAISETCVKRLEPMPMSTSSTRVAPVNPNAACMPSPTSAPTTPPGAKGNAAFSPYRRKASSPQLAASSTTKPMPETASERRSPGSKRSICR
jgi:hypothetical protein